MGAFRKIVTAFSCFLFSQKKKKNHLIGVWQGFEYTPVQKLKNCNIAIFTYKFLPVNSDLPTTHSFSSALKQNLFDNSVSKCV